MTWIEDTTRRKAKEKHYRDDVTGQWRTEFTIHDRHYKDSGGAWQEVDESLVDDGQDGFSKKCDKTFHTFRIAGGGARRWYPRRNVTTEYVDITNIQYWRTTGGGSWRNLTLPAAAWKNQGAEWDMANLYASITNTWKRIKSEFILKDTTAPTRLRFAVSFVGLTYNHSTGELTSTTDGLVWGTIDKPTAHYGTFPDKTNVPVTATYDGTYIEWSADVTGAQYPVYVDPTFTDQGTTAIDCWLDQMSPTTNNDDARLVSGDWYTSNSSDCVTLIKFDLSSIPSGSQISSATLSLWHYTEYAAYTRNHVVHRVLRNWVENQATWNVYSTGNNWGTAGCKNSTTDYEATAVGSLSLSSTEDNGEKQWTLDPDLMESLIPDGGFTNYGFRIGTTHVTNENDEHEFRSSDYTTAEERPKLVVEYTSGAADPEGSLIGGKLLRGGLLTHGVLVRG